MNRIILGVALALLVGIVWLLLSGVLDAREPRISMPPEVPIADVERHMPPLAGSGKAVSRTEVDRAEERSLSTDIASRGVETLGRLDGAAEAGVVEDWESQRRSLDGRIANLVTPASGDPLAVLRAALDAAELRLEKVRRDALIDMTEKHDYATIKAQGARPPDVEGFEQVVHGPVSRAGKESVDVVFYLPVSDSRTKAARDHWTKVYWEYYGQYVEHFNAQPLAVRRARIRAYNEAMSQRTYPKREGQGGLSPEEIQAAMIPGPIGVDERNCIVYLRR